MDKNYLPFSSELAPNQKGFIQLNGWREQITFGQGNDEFAYEYFGTVLTIPDHNFIPNERLYITRSFLNTFEEIWQSSKIIPIVCVEKVSKKGNFYKSLHIDLDSEQYYDDWSFLGVTYNAEIVSHGCLYTDKWWDDNEKNNFIYDIDNYSYSGSCCGGNYSEGLEYIIPTPIKEISIPIVITNIEMFHAEKKAYYIDEKSFINIKKYMYNKRYVPLDIGYMWIDWRMRNFRMCPKCYFEVKIYSENATHKLCLQYAFLPTIHEVKSNYFRENKEQIEVFRHLSGRDKLGYNELWENVAFINTYVEYKYENIPFLFDFDDKINTFFL